MEGRAMTVESRGRVAHLLDRFRALLGLLDRPVLDRTTLRDQTGSKWAGAASQRVVVGVIEDDRLRRWLAAALRSLRLNYNLAWPEPALPTEWHGGTVVLDDQSGRRLEELRGTLPGARSLLITSDGNESVERTAHERGFHGYVVRPLARQQFERALRAVEGEPILRRTRASREKPAERTFLDEARDLLGLYEKSDLSAKEFAKAHGKGRSALLSETALAREVGDRCSRLVKENYTFFKKGGKSWLVESLRLHSDDVRFRLLEEIVARQADGQACNLEWVKGRVDELLGNGEVKIQKERAEIETKSCPAGNGDVGVKDGEAAARSKEVNNS